MWASHDWYWVLHYDSIIISREYVDMFCCLIHVQRRSQNAEKVTHIKGRQLDQAMILFSSVPFQRETSLKGKNLLPEGANSFLNEHFLIVGKIIFITLSELP